MSFTSLKHMLFEAYVVKSPELMKKMMILDSTTLVATWTPLTFTLLLVNIAHIPTVIPISTTQVTPKAKYRTHWKPD